VTDEATYVLDASAVLALLNGEPGAAKVDAALDKSVISAVNVAEVVGKLCESGVPEEAVDRILAGLNLSIVAFDADQAVIAGRLRPLTKALGLSLGDRACLGLAISRKARALTAERVWRQAKIGADIALIR
jgi:ribonuclease VapC